MQTACTVCEGLGRRLAPETVAYDILRALPRAARTQAPGALTVYAAPPVIAALSGPAREALDELILRLGRPVALQSAKEYDAGHFDIVASAAAGQSGHG
jgi:Ribonuclease G/E